MCSDAPDTSGVNAAAVRSAALGEEALSWWKSVYEDQAPARARAAQIAEDVSLSQRRAMDTQTALSTEAADYNRETFRPLERSVVADAVKFDTEAERERLAGLAAGDVEAAAASARAASQRAMGRAGINLADGRRTAADADLQRNITLAKAGAMTKARSDATQLGRAMKMDAISLGRGLPAQQATAQQIALQAGNNATANGQIPVQLAQQGAQQVGQGYQTAMQGAGQSGNLYATAAKLGQTDDSGVWGALGQVGGAALMKFSDENMKEGIEPVDDQITLQAVRETPVSNWKYRPDSPAADGGQPHTGPMAQDVNATMGERTAPGGKQVDVISLAGKTLSAVKAVDENVVALTQRVERLERDGGGH